MSSIRRYAIPAGVGAVLAAGALTLGMTSRHQEPVSSAEVARAARPDPSCAAPTATLQALSQVFRCATHAAMPSVVYVEVESHGQQRQQGRSEDPFRGTPFEGMVPQVPQQQQQMPQMGSGSGFVFRPGGYILTNNHVVDGMDRVTVVTQDRSERTADVVGRDPNTDIAVLKVKDADLPVAALGNSDQADVGDWVLALGYPLRLGVTVTSGIISAKGREIGILRQNQQASAPVEYYLQTDAAINPGNSGGPLVDLDGRVIGMNSAIASPTGYFSGYGFAIPINIVMHVADDLIKYGEVHRARLGLGVKDVTPADAQVYKLTQPQGAVVSQVPEDSPAGAAGMQLGDVITAVDGQTVQSAGDLIDKVTLQAPGSTVKLSVVRYGRDMTFNVKLGEFKPAVRADHENGEATGDDIDRLGFRAETLTPDVAQQMDLDRNAKGAVVTRVDPMSEAARAGLLSGMVIEKANGRDIHSQTDLQDALRAVKRGDAVSLIVKQQDGSEVILNYLLRD